VKILEIHDDERPLAAPRGRLCQTAIWRPEKVLDYLGRYTHRVAISNNQLKALKDGQVTFTYQDYKHGQQHKVMAVADEFLRRFLLSVHTVGDLPLGRTAPPRTPLGHTPYCPETR
jgi:hypothetical protein